MAILQFFKIGAVGHLEFLTVDGLKGSACVTMLNAHHLGFVVHAFGPPHKNIWWSLTVCKFCWNRCSNFDNMQVLIFCELGLKTPIQAPQTGSFGEIWLPKWGAVSSRPSKRHLLAQKHVMCWWSKSVHLCEPKNKVNYSGPMPTWWPPSEYRWRPLLKMARSETSVIPFLVPHAPQSLADAHCSSAVLRVLLYCQRYCTGSAVTLSI